jgi:hypothetical protein
MGSARRHCGGVLGSVLQARYPQRYRPARRFRRCHHVPQLHPWGVVRDGSSSSLRGVGALRGAWLLYKAASRRVRLVWLLWMCRSLISSHSRPQHSLWGLGQAG